MRRTRPALLIAAALLVGSTIGVGRAAAQGGEPGATELYRLGVEAYDLQQYARAAELFTRCHQRSGDASLLFNIAQAHRLAGDCSAAARFYRRFLEEDPRARNRPDAETKLADMERCVRAESAAAQEPATPSAAPAPLARTDVTAVARDRDQPAGGRVGLWVAGGGGVVLGLSAFFWYRAWDADRQLDQLFADGGVYDQKYQDLAGRLDTSRTLAIATTAVGAAAIAGSLVYHFAIRPRRARADSAHASVQVTPGGAMLVVGCGL